MEQASPNLPEDKIPRDLESPKSNMDINVKTTNAPAPNTPAANTNRNAWAAKNSSISAEEAESPSNNTVAAIPDRTVFTTFWISLVFGLFGIDHFYLRSPMTGLAKALTLGGLGLWWLWDVLQLGFESKRVVTQGLTTPFNFVTGIARGALTEGKSLIVQRTDYFSWILSAISDMFGITALLEGRPAAFLRRLIDAVLLHAFWSSGTTFGYLMAAIFSFFTIVPAFFTIRAIFDPEELAKKGAPIPQNLIKLLNFFESWTGVIGENATAVVRHDYGLSAVDSKSAPKAFAYDTYEKIEAEREAAAAEAAGKAAGKSGKKKESWPISMLLGNVFGGILVGIVSLFKAIPQVKIFLLAGESYFADVRASRGETPDPIDFAGMFGVNEAAVNQLKGSIGDALTNKSKKEDKKKEETKEEELKHADGVSQRNQSYEMSGGARKEPGLSTEATVMGATVIALIAGGAIKMAVDSLVGN
jgi:hypothetical protein